MKSAWAIGNLTDEVIETSKQLGVKNIIHYGGPGQTDWGGKSRTLEQYKDLIIKMKTNDLELVSFEGGFVGIPS